MTEGALMFKSRTFQHPQLMLFPANEEDLWLQVKVRKSKWALGDEGVQHSVWHMESAQ